MLEGGAELPPAHLIGLTADHGATPGVRPGLARRSRGLVVRVSAVVADPRVLGRTRIMNIIAIMPIGQARRSAVTAVEPGGLRRRVGRRGSRVPQQVGR